VKGFIVVTNDIDDLRICLPVTDIKAVVEGLDGCFIETDNDSKGLIGVDVTESFDDIMSAMGQAL